MSTSRTPIEALSRTRPASARTKNDGAAARSEAHAGPGHQREVVEAHARVAAPVRARRRRSRRAARRRGSPARGSRRGGSIRRASGTSSRRRGRCRAARRRRAGGPRAAARRARARTGAFRCWRITRGSFRSERSSDDADSRAPACSRGRARRRSRTAHARPPGTRRGSPSWRRGRGSRRAGCCRGPASGPSTRPAAHAPAEREHRVARAVVGARGAVDARRAPELGGHEQHDVVEQAAEVASRRRRAPGRAAGSR